MLAAGVPVFIFIQNYGNFRRRSNLVDVFPLKP
jgi:hypothetical protein